MYEYKLWKKNGKYIDLSEQQLVDVVYPKNGCSGGRMRPALEYIAKNDVYFQSAYSYNASDNMSLSNTTKIASNVFNKTNNFSWYTLPNDERLMAYTIFTNGWMSVGINADALQFYKTGVISNATCSRNVNHAVNSIGYGYDSTAKMDYWLLRNSWGPKWGDQGYFKIQRNVGACGIDHSYQNYRVNLA
jgi:hypothetical protein